MALFSCGSWRLLLAPNNTRSSFLSTACEFINAANWNLQEAGQFVELVYANYAWGQDILSNHYEETNVELLRY